MKYNEMQAAIAHDRHAKATGRKDESEPVVDEAAYARKPLPPPGEPVIGETAPLLVNLEAEDWLLQRLKDHGYDPYAHGAVFSHMRDRLRTTILNNGIQVVITGRHNGKLENYAQTFERLYGEPLEAPASKSKRAKEGA